jgi:cell volume regulation protein A
VTTLALYATVLGILTLASVMVSRTSNRVGLPVLLAFLALGILAGEEGLLRFGFSNYRLSFDLSSIALVLILFDGGLNTAAERIRFALWPSLVLATAGVAITAGALALSARWFLPAWTDALLLGSILSSTDAAAVFSILRGSGIRLKGGTGTVLEVESGLNDPMAFLLTAAFTQALVEHHPLGYADALQIPLALVVGGALGLAIGWIGRIVLRIVRPPVGGLFPLLTLAIALVSFGMPTLVGGSGFLAAYLAGAVIGNGPMPYSGGIKRVHDSTAWLAQVLMFLLLGLLVTPSLMVGAWRAGLVVAICLVFIARPLAVAICLLPFRYRLREVTFIGWAGLRGAVPIVLAIYPVMAGASGAEHMFNIVFFVVVANTIIPGSMVGRVARWLGLASDEPLPPPGILEISSPEILSGGEISSYSVDRSSAVAGAKVSDLELPSGCSLILVIRNRTIIAPNGATVLELEDHVYVLCRPEDMPYIHLIFGRHESD